MTFIKPHWLLSALAALLTSGAACAGDADFTLMNRTGFTLREIYISSANRDSWGNDRMGDDVLNNGKSRLFTFSDTSACKKDLKVIFDENEASVVWKNFDLCKIEKITLKFNKSNNAATADIE